MTQIKIEKWWKSKEIPLAESDWRNVRLYCTEGGDPWDWKECVYFIRLSPPFSIAYGPGEKDHSPLVYVGSGAIRQRWRDHLGNWITGLGRWLPGARYEIWLFEHQDFRAIESDALKLFVDAFTRLPLANRKRGAVSLWFDYPDDHPLHEVAESDRRFWWAIRPTQKEVREYFEKGAVEQ